MTSVKTSGNVGNIRAHGLNSADIGGSVTGGIQIVSWPGSPSQITQLLDTSVGGSILGNINCEAGSIGNLVVAGTIGTASVPVTISARSDTIINKITCSAFYGTLRGQGTNVAPATGEFRTTSGPISGTLRMSGIYDSPSQNGEGFYCAGDLNADVTMLNNVDAPIQVAGTLPSTRTLRIGGSLAVGKEITFGTGPTVPGLAGQVIINAGNGSGNIGGSIRVGGSSGTLLSPLPAYNNLSSALGGGSVGLVPYRIHGTNCSPLPGAVRSLSDFLSTTAPQPIVIEYYGPLVAGSAPPVRIDWVVNGSNINLSDPAVTTPMGGPFFNVRLSGRQLIIEPTAARQANGLLGFVLGNFIVTPLAGNLACGGLDGITPNVDSAPFSFSIRLLCSSGTQADIVRDCDGNGVADQCQSPPASCGTCIADYNFDGVLNSDDLSDFVTDYFSQTIGPGGYALVGSCYPNFYGYKSDFNGDCAVNADDLADFITAYFNGC